MQDRIVSYTGDKYGNRKYHSILLHMGRNLIFPPQALQPLANGLFHKALYQIAVLRPIKGSCLIINIT